MGYKLAAILDGQMCFCKAGLVVFSQQDIIGSCMNITCSGDSTTYCGASKRYLVYGVGDSYTILNVTTNSTMLTLNTAVNITIKYTDNIQYTGNIVSSFFLTKTGYNLIETDLSDSGLTDFSV
jgi:hypothetical protein